MTTQTLTTSILLSVIFFLSLKLKLAIKQRKSSMATSTIISCTGCKGPFCYDCIGGVRVQSGSGDEIPPPAYVQPTADAADVGKINKSVMPCPICNEIMEKMARYPQMVCQACLTLPITDQDGNRVEFHNIDFYGGFQSTHYIDNSPVLKTDHSCFIKGVACYAAEARFGGIVIQTK